MLVCFVLRSFIKSSLPTYEHNKKEDIQKYWPASTESLKKIAYVYTNRDAKKE